MKEISPGILDIAKNSVRADAMQIYTEPERAEKQAARKLIAPLSAGKDEDA